MVINGMHVHPPLISCLRAHSTDAVAEMRKRCCRWRQQNTHTFTQRNWQIQHQPQYRTNARTHRPSRPRLPLDGRHTTTAADDDVDVDEGQITWSWSNCKCVRCRFCVHNLSLSSVAAVDVWRTSTVACVFRQHMACTMCACQRRACLCASDVQCVNMNDRREVVANVRRVQYHHMGLVFRSWAQNLSTQHHTQHHTHSKSSYCPTSSFFTHALTPYANACELTVHTANMNKQSKLLVEIRYCRCGRWWCVVWSECSQPDTI